MSWSRIHGHDAALDELRRALARQRVPHALLITGPDGVGKRLVAREFVKALFCAGRAGDPCDACGPCRRLDADLEADAGWFGPPAGKRDFPIAVIREQVLVFLQSKPRTLPFKAAVIDEAHRMNAAAANAFLKALEEPPGGARFVLLARGARELLPTIRSRCQIVRLGPLAPDAMRAVLARFDWEEDERTFLARHSDGSPGRALALHEDGGYEHGRWLIDAVFRPVRQNPYELAAELDARTKQHEKETLIERRPRLKRLLAVLAAAVRDRLICQAVPAVRSAPVSAGPERAEGAGAAATSGSPAGSLKRQRDLAACLDALHQIDLNLHPPLVFEQLFQTLWTPLERAG